MFSTLRLEKRVFVSFFQIFCFPIPYKITKLQNTELRTPGILVMRRLCFPKIAVTIFPISYGPEMEWTFEKEVVSL